MTRIYYIRILKEEIWEKAAIYADSQYDEESAPSQWTKAFHQKFKELDEIANKLTNTRKKIAKEFEDDIKDDEDYDEFEEEDDEFSENSIDDIDDIDDTIEGDEE